MREIALNLHQTVGFAIVLGSLYDEWINGRHDIC